MATHFLWVGKKIRFLLDFILYVMGRKLRMNRGSAAEDEENETGLPLNINMAWIINEKLSKDDSPAATWGFFFYRALVREGKGGQGSQQVDKEGGSGWVGLGDWRKQVNMKGKVTSKSDKTKQEEERTWREERSEVADEGTHKWSRRQKRAREERKRGERKDREEIRTAWWTHKPFTDTLTVIVLQQNGQDFTAVQLVSIKRHLCLRGREGTSANSNYHSSWETWLSGVFRHRL